MTSKPTILIVDDDPLIRKLFRLALSREGYRVVEAANYGAAEEQVLKTPPDLVITDLRLPDGEGVGLARWIRARSDLRHVPVLALSGVDGMARENVALQHLFDDFFLKPIAPSVLKQVVHRYLSEAAPASEVPPDPLVHQYRTAQSLTRRATHRRDQLAVLASMTEVISRTTDLDGVLADGLDRYLDAGGFSLGAVYLWHPDTGLQLTGQSGCPPEQLARLGDLFGNPDLLFEALEAPDALIIPSPKHPPELIQGSGYASMLLIPMVAERELLGVLLLASKTEAFAREGKAFGRAAQSQITLAVVLAAVQSQRDVFWRSFQRIADASPVGVLTHRDGELEYFNAAARGLLGGMQGYRQILQRSLPDSGASDIQIRFPDGAERELRVTVTRLRDRFGVRYESWLIEDGSQPEASIPPLQ